MKKLRRTICMSILVSLFMPAPVGIGATQNTRIESAADSQLDPAVRMTPPKPRLNPESFTGCDEMEWYRQYVGLPAVFDRLGWRESNCKNNVRTFCCYGYWQEYISLWLSTKSAYRDQLIVTCGITGVASIYGNSPEQKLANACAAKVVYDISGLVPWRR